VNLTETGTYTLIVAAQSFSNVSNTFSLNVWLTTPSTAALTLNTNVAGDTIPAPGAFRNYTFTGVPGQRLVINGQSAAASFAFNLLDPFGSSVTNVGFLTNSFVTPALKYAGTYTLEVYGGGSATGAYQFKVLDGDTQPPLTFGAGEADFQVTLSAPSPVPVTVQYATIDGTATANQDYRPVSGGVLTIPANATTATIPVELLNDGVIPQAGFETFQLTLTNPVNGQFTGNASSASATATIVEGPIVTITDVTGNAPASGTTTFTFTVSLSTPVNAPVSVSYTTADNTAHQPGDYILASGVLNFPALSVTQTINVTVNVRNGTVPMVEVGAAS
jgi:hypothetical protein